jgi:multimeric flavodoxin WrbA
MRLSDAVVFATPVYIHDLSESLQAFLSRLFRICKHNAGNHKIHGKKAVGICVAGGSGIGATACAARLEKILTFCGFETVDMMPIRRQNLEAKLIALKEMGKSLFTGE